MQIIGEAACAPTAEVIIVAFIPRNRKKVPMARPRKRLPSDPFADLSKKTEILEREMSAQRAAIERLKQLGQVRSTRSASATVPTERAPTARMSR